MRSELEISYYIQFFYCKSPNIWSARLNPMLQVQNVSSIIISDFKCLVLVMKKYKIPLGETNFEQSR